MAKGNTKISLTQDDFDGSNFKHAPGGTYFVKISPKSEVKPGTNGNNALIKAAITKGPHKGVTFLDNIGAHVNWKIAQLLAALGITLKKAPKTLEEMVKFASGKDLRVILKVEPYNGKKQNKVVTWLPLEAGEDEDIDDDEEESDDDEDDDDDDADEEEETESDDDDDDDDSDEDEDEEDESDDDAGSDDEDEEEDDDDDEEDDSSDEEDDDDDDEPVTPAKRGAAKKAPAKKAAAKKTTAKKTGRKR